MEAFQPEPHRPVEPVPPIPVGQVGKRWMTAKDLRDSGFLGMWKDRSNGEDAADFVRELRERAAHGE